MRFITTLNNQKCMEWKINATQGILFSLLYDVEEWAEKEIVNGEEYYYIPKESVIEHLPMYFDKIDTVYRIIKVLHEKGLVEYVKKKKRDYVRLTKKGLEWGLINERNEGKRWNIR